jgi:hypothetical protein
MLCSITSLNPGGPGQRLTQLPSPEEAKFKVLVKAKVGRFKIPAPKREAPTKIMEKRVSMEHAITSGNPVDIGKASVSVVSSAFSSAFSFATAPVQAFAAPTLAFVGAPPLVFSLLMLENEEEDKEEESKDLEDKEEATIDELDELVISYS